MQRLSYELISRMSRRVRVTAITWGGSQKLLPFFLMYAIVKSFWAAWRGIDLVNLGDPILAPIGWMLKYLFRLPIVVVVHGLDITFPMRPYQWLIPRLLRRFDRIVCISGAARASCMERGIPPQKCVVIHPGVEARNALPSRDAARKRLESLAGQSFEGIVILLTVARLVPRKGVAWFLECVLPQVSSVASRVCYVIVGSGPESAHVRSLAARPDLADKVVALGRVSDDDLEHIYVAGDLFIMPNLPIAGDLEGFGLVTLEAAVHGLPVLASDLEGIRDAIVPERTGRLLPAGNANAWAQGVIDALNQPFVRSAMAEQAREIARDRYGWERMVEACENLFYDVCRGDRR